MTVHTGHVIFSNKNLIQQPEHSVLRRNANVYLHVNIRPDTRHEMQPYCFDLLLRVCSKNPDGMKTKTTSSTNTLGVTVDHTLNAQMCLCWFCVCC